MTRADAVRCWAERWRGLRAWGRPLEEVSIEIQPYRGQAQCGTAWPTQRRCVVRVGAGGHVVYDLETALHELAHCAAPGDEHHGPKWRRPLVAAVLEVTGIAVADDGQPFELLDRACVDALRAWWHSSGQAFLYRLALAS